MDKLPRNIAEESSAQSNFTRWKKDHPRESLTRADHWELWSLFHLALAEGESQQVAEIAAFEMLGDPISVLALDYGYTASDVGKETDELNWTSLYERAVIISEDIRLAKLTDFFAHSPRLMDLLYSISLQIASEAKRRLFEQKEFPRTKAEIIHSDDIRWAKFHASRAQAQESTIGSETSNEPRRRSGRLRKIYQARERIFVLERLEAAIYYVREEGLKNDLATCMVLFKELYEALR